jgi:hypothetical protein
MKGGRTGKTKELNRAKNHKKQADGEMMTGFMQEACFL